MQNNGGPKCPHPKRLRALAELIEQDLPIDAKANADLLDALEWLANMLDNRSLYHKKRNLKQKILIEMAREQGLDDQAEALTKTALHDYVSSQEPDNDDTFKIEE
jgi:hypothetical protein